MRPVSDRDRGHRGGLVGVEQPVAVGGEIGVVLRQVPAQLDDRLAQLDGTLAGDVLAGPGPAGGLVAGGHQPGEAVGARGVGEAGRVADPRPLVRRPHNGLVGPPWVVPAMDVGTKGGPSAHPDPGWRLTAGCGRRCRRAGGGRVRPVPGPEPGRGFW